MNYAAEGLGILDDMYLRSEEIIKLAEDLNVWRQETIGVDIFDITPSRSDIEKELFTELLDAFTGAINIFSKRYPQLKITAGEGLKLVRYNKGSQHPQTADLNGNNRVLSGVLFLNTNVDGGILQFPIQQVDIQPREGRLVLFPSTFTHPYLSTEITDGVRYAVVGWFR